MKRLIVLLFAVCMLALPLSVFAESRISSTITGYSASTLVKRGDWKIYRITFVATGNTASFTIYDSLTIGGGLDSNVKTEGSEATSGNGKSYDFSNKPLEGSTGLYLHIISGNVVVEYE